MNVKSKTVLTGINSQKKWVFTGASGSELATILSSAESKTTTFILRHSKRLAPSMYFLALVGCLRLTTDSETVIKMPNVYFNMLGTKLAF